MAFAFACAAMLEGKLDQTVGALDPPVDDCGLGVPDGAASPWAAGGRTTSSAGAGFGSGTRWRTPHSCRGSWAPRSSTRSRSRTSAGSSRAGPCCSLSSHSRLSLLGTFLVRSGVLVSVHSFAADPTRGIFILAFLVIMIGGSLALYAWRAPLLRSTAGFELGARESFLLFNNILLVIAAAIVFGGTIAPLIAEGLGLPHAVGGNAVLQSDFPDADAAAPRAAAGRTCTQTGSGAACARRSAHSRNPRHRAVAAVAVGFGVFAHAQVFSPSSDSLWVPWIILSSLVDPIDRYRRRLSLSRSVLGMTIAHIGLGLFVVGITRRAILH